MDNGIYGYLASNTAFKTEFRIPADPLGNQIWPLVTALPNGGFVVGWSNEGPDQNGVDDPYFTPFARFFDANGELLQVALDIPSDIWTRARNICDNFPGTSVATLEDGGFVTAYWWDDDNQPGPILLGESYISVYDNLGQAVTGPIKVTAQPNMTDFSEFTYPEIVNLDNGTLMVAWTADLDEYIGRTDYEAIQYRYITETGALLGSVMNMYAPEKRDSDENDDLEQIVSLGGGYAGIVFSDWQYYNSSNAGDYYDAKLQIIAPDGEKVGDAVKLNATTREDLSQIVVTFLQSGEIMTNFMAERDNDDVFVTFFESSDSSAPDLFMAGADQNAYFDLNGDGTIEGSSGDDLLFVKGTDVRLEGRAGSDELYGGSGNDTLVGGTGADTLEGGDGTDTAVYTGNRADYSFSTAVDGIHLISGGPDGGDKLTSVEQVRFADQTVAATALFPAAPVQMNDIYGSAGRYETMIGTSAADAFHFRSELTNGTKERDVLFGFDPADDRIILDGAQVETTLQTAGGVILVMRGDGDALYLRGDDLEASTAASYVDLI